MKAAAPAEWVRLQEERWEINNLPAIGHESNHGLFAQVQVNYAGVELANSSTGLDKNLGNAGLPHFDQHDDPQGYTCMFAMNHNFDKYKIHPGMFFFLELGLYMELANFRPVYFSGLHFHGGSPPRAPHGMTQIPDDAVRMVVVEYPNEPLLSGESVSQTLAVTASGRGRVEFLPSDRYDPSAQRYLQTGPLNLFRDGDSTMTRPTYLQCVPRQVAISLDTMLSQSPHLSLNFDALKSLFKDKSSGEVIDYYSGWEYPVGMDDSRLESMRSVAERVRTKKLEFSLTVPTQLRILYNAGKLKLEADANGGNMLQVQHERMMPVKKKRKGNFVPYICVLTY